MATNEAHEVELRDDLKRKFLVTVVYVTEGLCNCLYLFAAKYNFCLSCNISFVSQQFALELLSNSFYISCVMVLQSDSMNACKFGD